MVGSDSTAKRHRANPRWQMGLFMDMPQDWVTTGGLIIATAAGAAACAGAIARVVRGGQTATVLGKPATALLAVAAVAVFVYRLLVVHENATPLQSHVDGLALLAAMLGLVALYLQWTRRLAGLAMFLLPAATGVALWGVCASWWTFRLFGDADVATAWHSIHLVSVYVGMLGIAAAAGAGALWLYVDRQLRSKDHRGQRLKRLGRLANLESIENTMTGSAVAGFALMTIALISGLVIIAGNDSGGATKLGEGWWYSPKVVLTGAVWLIFALVMNVRFVSAFRGRRAAVLCIVGFVLIVLVMGISQTLPSVTPENIGPLDDRLPADSFDRIDTGLGG